jgi:hypothetical protein
MVGRMQPSGSPHATASGSAGRSAPPGPVPRARYGFIVRRERRAFRVRHIASYANPGGLETPNFAAGVATVAHRTASGCRSLLRLTSENCPFPMRSGTRTASISSLLGDLSPQASSSRTLRGVHSSATYAASQPVAWRKLCR